MRIGFYPTKFRQNGFNPPGGSDLTEKIPLRAAKTVVFALTYWTKSS
jgi:hypothetical protein